MIETTFNHYLQLASGDTLAAAILTAVDVGQKQKPDNASLTVGEAAKILALSPDKVYDLCREGRLRHKRIGRVIRLHPADLEEFQRDATKLPAAKGLRCLR